MQSIKFARRTTELRTTALVEFLSSKAVVSMNVQNLGFIFQVPQNLRANFNIFLMKNVNAEFRLFLTFPFVQIDRDRFWCDFYVQRQLSVVKIKGSNQSQAYAHPSGIVCSPTGKILQTISKKIVHFHLKIKYTPFCHKITLFNPCSKL